MKKKGGVRVGAGRKKIGPEERILRARVAPHHENALLLAGNGNISEGIRRLAERHWRLIHGEIKADGTPSKAIQYIIDTAPLYAQAKAHRVYLEEARKSKKAQLMKECQETVLGKQEVFAYSHQDYTTLLKGLEVAVEQEEKYRWMLIAAQARIEVWKAEQYTNRAEMRAGA